MMLPLPLCQQEREQVKFVKAMKVFRNMKQINRWAAAAHSLARLARPGVPESQPHQANVTSRQPSPTPQL